MVEGSYRYLVSKGKINQPITAIGKWNSYSLSIYSSREDGYQGWTTVLTKAHPDTYMNLCPETHTDFVNTQHLRSLAEFFRNKTIDKVYFGINSSFTKQVIDKFSGIGEVLDWKNGTVVEKEEWAVLTAEQFLSVGKGV